MEHLSDVKENILNIQEDKRCYVCGRTPVDFKNCFLLREHDQKIKKTFEMFWETWERELVDTNLIKDWIRFLDEVLYGSILDNYSDFDMNALRSDNTFFEKLHHLPFFIYFGKKHFNKGRYIKLVEILEYLRKVNSTLKNFGKDQSIEDLKLISVFFDEFYSRKIMDIGDNYAIRSYQRNIRESESKLIPLFEKENIKKVNITDILDAFENLLSELEERKSIEELAFEFEFINISFNFKNYEPTLTVFICPVCEHIIMNMIYRYRP